MSFPGSNLESKFIKKIKTFSQTTLNGHKVEYLIFRTFGRNLFNKIWDHKHTLHLEMHLIITESVTINLM